MQLQLKAIRLRMIACILYVVLTPCYGQRSGNAEGESLFRSATHSLLNKRYEESEIFFQQALEAFKRTGEQSKVHECLMGIAMTAFFRNEYEVARGLFRQLRGAEANSASKDPQRLKLIDSCIHACNKNIRAAKKTGSAHKPSSPPR